MKKQDLRIIRTDRRIRETFLQLIDEVGFDAVTIKLLTDRAEVNRGTFYHHYADKYELLERMTNEIFEKIEATFEREIPFVLINKTEDSPYRRIIPFLTFLYEHRTLMRILLSPVSDGCFGIGSVITCNEFFFQGYTNRENGSFRKTISSPIFLLPISVSLNRG